jgi:hypothetical protein
VPNSDIFVSDSGLQTVATTSQTGLIAWNTPATKRVWIVGVRMSIGTTLAAAGNSVIFSLARISNTPVGQAQVTVSKQDAAAPNSLVGSTVPTLGTGWLTAPTISSPVLGEWELPQTTGSMWEEFPPLGYEWGVAVSSGVAMFVTTSVSTSTPLGAQLIWSE